MKQEEDEEGEEEEQEQEEDEEESKMQRKDLGDGGWENIGQGTGKEGSNRYEEDSIVTVASIVRRLRDAKKMHLRASFQDFFQTPLC